MLSLPRKALRGLLAALFIVSILFTGCNNDFFNNNEYDTEESWYEEESWEGEGAEEEDWEEDWEEDDEEEARSPAPRERNGASGFQPEVHGFSFDNYGDETPVTNLTAAELQRLFGDKVCSNLTGGTCILTPQARQWMEQVNAYMDDGHCEGMAVLSSLMYYEQIDPADFGGAVAYDLELLGNHALQREIAYWFITQVTYPGGAHKVNESPMDVVNTLMATFDQGLDAGEWWALGIYKSDFTGGHAVTPIGVEEQDGGIYHILVYDNNYAGVTRIIEVDSRADTWWYKGSSNPAIEEDHYDGDAELGNLEIVAISPRLNMQMCEFCEARTVGRTPGLATTRPGAPSQGYYEVWLQGPADLLIVTDDGDRLGYVDGKLVNEIKGATFEVLKLFGGIDVWAQDKEPVYRIPLDVSFDITVDGSRLSEAVSSAVTLIGPGYFLAIENIWLEPGEADIIGIYVDGARQQLTYVTDYSESPIILLGRETEEADYAFMIQATEMTGWDDTFDIGIDLAEGDFFINTSYNEAAITFDFMVLRIDSEGEHTFSGTDLVMEPGSTAYLNFMEWKEGGTSMWLDMDYENDGEIDESFELFDEGGLGVFYWDLED